MLIDKFKFGGGYAKRIILTYLVILCPLLVGFFWLHNFIIKIQRETQRQVIYEGQKQRANLINYIVEDIFEEIANNIQWLKGSTEVGSYIEHPSAASAHKVGELFLATAGKEKNFDVIRMFNAQGVEVARVNNKQLGEYLVPESELQDKSECEYYQKASKLHSGEIYISDLDLDKDNGTAACPSKPVIRVATALYSANNVYRGLLVINYLGSDILHSFNKQFEGLETKIIQSSLVNNSGYYLYRNLAGNNSGIIFGKSDKSATIYAKNPELWERIKKEKIGLFENGDELGFFMQINPLENLNTSTKNDFHWTVISGYKRELTAMANPDLFLGTISSDIIVFTGVCLVLLVMVIIYYLLHHDKQQLSVTSRIATETNDAVVITDKNTNIIYVNKAFEKATGYTKDEVMGLKTNYFKSGKYPPAFYKKMWHSINTTGSWQGELWDKKKNGLFYPKKLSIYAVKNSSNNEVEKYIGIFTDLTNIKEHQNNVNKLQNYNVETNLPNENLLRRLLDKNIDKNVENFAVMCFSITNFNNFLLKSDDQSSTYVKAFLSSVEEMLQDDDFIAQISKSIFVIGISLSGEYKKVDNFVELFFEKSRKAHTVNDEEVYFEVKAGISIYPDDGKTSNELINNAHIALESSIKLNKKSYVYFDNELKADFEREIQLNSLLRSAIANDELEVYYQPQVESTTGRVVGAEALLRWNSEEMGPVSPVVFIPLAEKSGLILEIGYWVMEQVFRDYPFLKCYMDSEFRISVNISSLQFMDKRLIPKFKELAWKYAVNLSNFEIEITESTFIEDIHSINRKLEEFRRLGITVAIDDFGTGFSSLSYLKHMYIDKLKIDRSFIKDYPETDNGGIARVITSIAQELNLKVITEGAETGEQVAYLESIGCKYIQGFYYSRPLPKDDFSNYIKGNMVEC